MGHDIDTWHALEAAYKAGKTRAIGISNFNSRQTLDLIHQSSVRPMVDQIETHLFLQQWKMHEFLEKENKLPDALVACVGGGSNSIGLFYPFVNDESVAMYGVEAAGLGIDTPHHAATITKGRPGVLHGTLMDVLQDENGQILEAFSISAGLDYPGIGPEHSYFNAVGRAKYVDITDEEALEGFKILSRTEGIIPALESSHAIAYAVKLAKELGADKSMIVCLSGRGDKDVVQVKERLEAEKEVKK